MYKNIYPLTSLEYIESDDKYIEGDINDILLEIMRNLKLIRHMVEIYGTNYNQYQYIWKDYIA